MDAIPPQPTTNNSWTWFIIQTLVLGVLLYIVIFSVNFAEISKNWSEYRCNPTIIPFASVFGHNTAENFNYCMQNIFNSQTGAVTGPFATIMSTMLGSFMTFLQNINSLRLQISTFLGGIQKILQEFVDRFKILFNQVRTTSYRIQFLMKRVYATFFAIIYMGISGVTGAQNFGRTTLFGFLDTFCFAPDTLVHVAGRGRIFISQVKLGDIIMSEDGSNKSFVTAIYQFMADGQPMVILPYNKKSHKEIYVSSNHYIHHNGKWIRSEDHPQAMKHLDWSGGKERPLICLDTHNHRIPIGEHIFSDYMETNESDVATMKLIDSRLNGSKSKDNYKWKYESALDPSHLVQFSSDKTKSLDSIQIGDKISSGTVLGTVERITTDVVRIHNMAYSPSTNVWDKKENKWVRLGIRYPVETLNEPIRLKTLFIKGQPHFTLANGFTVRDGLEIYSPDIEEPTANILLDNEHKK